MRSNCVYYYNILLIFLLGQVQVFSGTISSVRWLQQDPATEGDILTVEVTFLTNMVEGLSIKIEIFEDDPHQNHLIDTLYARTDRTNKVRANWTALWLEDGPAQGRPEYFAKASFATLSSKSDLIHVEDIGNSRNDFSPINLNENVGSKSAKIGVSKDIDFFRVFIPSSGTLRAYTSGSLDTQGELQSSSGSKLADDDDSGSGNNFNISKDVNAGTYYVKVNGYSTNTGNYTLNNKGTFEP